MHHPFSVLKYVLNLYLHTSLVVVDDMPIQCSWTRESGFPSNDVVNHVTDTRNC